MNKNRSIILGSAHLSSLLDISVCHLRHSMTNAEAKTVHVEIKLLNPLLFSI